jgi:hypothetical protein
MAGTGAKRTGRRDRRPVRLLVIGLASSLGVTLAVAAVVVSVRHSADAAAQPLSIHAEPSSRTVAPGVSAQFSVRVTRRHSRPNGLGLSGRTSLHVATALPSGAGVSFAPQRGLASRESPHHSTTLTVTTAVNTPPGTYKLRVQAHRPHRSDSTSISLIVSGSGNSVGASPLGSPASTPQLTTPDAFTIAGVLPHPLTPGAAAPLDLTLVNQESIDLSISGLSVQVASISGPQTDPTHPCSASDFSVEQFSETPGFTLPASSTVSLSELGFTPTEWPEVSMLNLPVNQDGCKQASLSLSFSGTATEATP